MKVRLSIIAPVRAGFRNTDSERIPYYQKMIVWDFGRGHTAFKAYGTSPEQAEANAAILTAIWNEREDALLYKACVDRVKALKDKYTAPEDCKPLIVETTNKTITLGEIKNYTAESASSGRYEYFVECAIREGDHSILLNTRSQQGWEHYHTVYLPPIQDWSEEIVYYFRRKVKE